MPDIRDTKKVRQLAAELRDHCALHGVTLVAGEAEDILATRIQQIASDLGVTERTVVDRYLPPEQIPALAQSIGQANTEYKDAADNAEPVALAVTEAAHVVAALGMVTKLAVEALQRQSEPAEALAVATDTADAVVGIGAAMRTLQHDRPAVIGGQTPLYSRRVLHRTIELLRDGTWTCPCRSRHSPGSECDLQRNLASDLNLIGGWTSGSHEASADQR